MSATTLPPRVVPRIFTYLKKLLKYPRTRARFWVNAQCAYLVTRKPLNVRMGKGKGAKVRFYTLLKHNTPVAALTRLRSGLQKRLRRFISVRLGRPVYVLRPSVVGVEWAQRHRVQANFLRARASEVRALLPFIRRPLTKFFFSRLFRTAWRRPRLRWRLKWPLLSRLSVRLRARRNAWGAGVKATTPVWAGLGSLAKGLRRERQLRPVLRPRLARALTKRLRAVFRRTRRALLRSKAAPLRRVRVLAGRLRARELAVVAKCVYDLRAPTRPTPAPYAYTRPYRLDPRALWRQWGSTAFKPDPRVVRAYGQLTEARAYRPLSTRAAAFTDTVGLVLLSAVSSSETGTRYTVKGSLNPGETEPAFSSSVNKDLGDVLLAHVFEKGAFEPWPSVPLRPLLLTHMAFV